MEDPIPAVLDRLAQNGVSVQWRDGKAVFSATAEPPADIVALIDAHRTDISAVLSPEADILRARPPDVSDDRWEAALRGLRAFLASGHGAEAECLGWSKTELYASPKRWANISACGVALLIGDAEVADVTSTEIRIRTASGSIQTFYRQPQIDYGLVFRTRLKEFGLAAFESDEPRLRAIEHTVLLYQRDNPGADLATATAAVQAAINAHGN
jgi:hypothetical protein